MIDWDLVTIPENMDNAFYVYDYENDSYASYVDDVGANGGSNKIATMQGFFVHVDQTTTLELTNDVRTVGDNTSYMKISKNENDYLLKLILDGEGYSDETVIRFKELSTNGFDSDYDAFKLMGSGNNLNFYTKIGPDKISINSQPFPTSSKVIPMYLEVGKTGTYTFMLNYKDEIDTNITLFIEDTKTDSLHDINKSGPLSFYFDKNESNNRFNLRFKFNGEEEEIEEELEEEKVDFKMYYFNDCIRIKGLEEFAELEIYSITGQLIKKVSINTKNALLNIKELSSGCYVLKLNKHNEVITEKILIHKVN